MSGPSFLRPLRAGIAVAVAAAVTAALVPAVSAQAGTGMHVDVVLPPGNSQYFSLEAQATAGVQEIAAGQGLGPPPNPDSWGDNVDDQRELYWNYEFRDGGLRPEPFCDNPQTPRAGVTLCIDEYGVPVVYADDLEDLWFGVGYGVAQIRLFLVDAIRRTARGTLSELAGAGSTGGTVQDDVATRITTYSDAEFDAMLNASSADAITSAVGYRDGINAWIANVTSGRPDLLPAEYALLGEPPQPLTLTDISAIGVLFTRFVAAEGANEMENVNALRELEEEFGPEVGRQRFNDLMWQQDDGAYVTVPREEGRFPRTTAAADAAALASAFDGMADFAATIPLELATGPGTGDFEVPPGGLGLGVGPFASASSEAPNPAAAVAQFFEEFKGRLHGGSFMAMIGPDKTADGSALLMSEPQLLMAPQLLLEIEIHGAGMHSRGSTAPGVPVLGIGYNNDVAWALTTGNAKTIDSYIETTRPDSNADGNPEYFHDGVWKEQECRTETVEWRNSQSGVPFGPASNSEDIQVCRTVHGPIVATTADGLTSRSVQYAMWDREVETIDGVTRWPGAKNFAEFEDAMRRVTWNENTGYADKEGNIAFWHPGLHMIRDPRSDTRLPIPGTGEYDNDGFLAFDELPHAVNPARGFIVNWNNKPAADWLDGGGQSSTSYPAGAGARVAVLDQIIRGRDDWTFDGLRDIDKFAGSQDSRAEFFLPMLRALQTAPDLTSTEIAALALLLSWDGSANGPGADWTFDFASTPATVGAATTIFHQTMLALPDELFGSLRDVGDGYDWVEEQTSMGRHFYDMSPVLNLALRVLEPSSSTLTPSTDYTGGRTSQAIMRSVFGDVVDALTTEQGADPTAWRSDYGSMEPICASVGGTIGPCVQMPFLERGSWIHLVGFDAAEVPAPEPTVEETVDPAPQPLPATGGGLAIGGLMALGALALHRRRG